MIINLSMILLHTCYDIYPMKFMEKTADIFWMVEISAATKLTVISLKVTVLVEEAT